MFVRLVEGRSEEGEEGDSVIVVGARGTGGDFRGVVRWTVGVVER